ncbi:MAG: hypothetical protein BWY23_02473 [Spirochaetes bacterium ADurb.Bin218]|nr:MAG: hypothetical protein BWY23_02473 [Spirochaetes bacterium ADurb.Bin218]
MKKTGIKKIIINGIKCLLTEDHQKHLIPTKKYKHRYSLRHNEIDWTEPITVERFVFANWFGDILSPVPLLKEEEYKPIESWSISE